VIAATQTYPHVDMYETGLRAARPVLSLLNKNSKPALAFGHRPMLPHVMRQSSLDSPNREIQARAREMERHGALCATFFVGFPHADVPYAGSSAVVLTDGDAGQAQTLCDELLEMAWQAREQFVYRIEPLEKSLLRAKEMSAGPVMLLDHYDNCASGGTMDTMAVLAPFSTRAWRTSPRSRSAIRWRWSRSSARAWAPASRSRSAAGWTCRRSA